MRHQTLSAKAPGGIRVRGHAMAICATVGHAPAADAISYISPTCGVAL